MFLTYPTFFPAETWEMKEPSLVRDEVWTVASCSPANTRGGFAKFHDTCKTGNKNTTKQTTTPQPNSPKHQQNKQEHGKCHWMVRQVVKKSETSEAAQRSHLSPLWGNFRSADLVFCFCLCLVCFESRRQPPRLVEVWDSLVLKPAPRFHWKSWGRLSVSQRKYTTCVTLAQGEKGP